MNQRELPRPAALQLALRMQDQIGRGRFPPGAKYLGAETAARHFGVRKAVANQALQILAHRGLVIRKPRLGTIIAARPAATPDLARIVLVTQVDYPGTEGQQEGAITSGLQSVFPGSDVQLHNLEGSEASDRIANLIRDALKSSTPSGLIVIRGSLAVQQSAAESGLPSVVYGSVWPGVKLSGLNVDNAAIAMQLTRALFERGAKRVLLLRRDRTSPGENDLLQGAIDVSREMARQLDVLELPESKKLVRAAVRQHLSTVDDDCAVLAATPFLAAAVGRLMPLGAIACGSIHPVPGNPQILRCAADLDFRQQGQMLGQLLQRPEEPTLVQKITCHLMPQSNQK